MDDMIYNKIMDIVNGIGNLGSDTTGLTSTPETYSNAIYSMVMKIQSNVITPVALVLFSLLCILEFQRLAVQQSNMSGNMGMEIPFKAMFKIALCKIGIDMTPKILAAIYTTCNEIIANMSLSISEVVGPGVSKAALMDNISKMEFGVKLITSVEVLLIWFVFNFASIVIVMIVIGRMMEIYVMMAIAPLPMVALANEETSSIGKNFLKSFLAVCLQGVLIYIVLAMFGSLIGEVATDIDSTDINAILLQSLLYVCVLVMAIFSTGKLSKSICNAM